ncbi:MAG: RHS domain-containing protein, partial [Pseudomonadota bacterium]
MATSASYHYDALGQRIRKSDYRSGSSRTTWYLYSAEGLLAEIDDSGQIKRSYGWEADRPWGTRPLWQAEHSGSNVQYHYLHTTPLGTPTLATDSQGQIRWQAESEAFGQSHIQAGARTEIALRFPGQYFDSETGRHYNYFRDYDP